MNLEEVPVILEKGPEVAALVWTDPEMFAENLSERSQELKGSLTKHHESILLFEANQCNKKT